VGVKGSQRGREYDSDILKSRLMVNKWLLYFLFDFEARVSMTNVKRGVTEKAYCIGAVRA